MIFVPKFSIKDIWLHHGMLNALAVIEAHTGLEWSAFRNVLSEVA